MNRTKTLGAVGAALCLYACGGGGGGAPAASVIAPSTNTTPVSTPPPPVADAASFRTPEYSHMGTLDQIGAADAYALGYTGKNVLVGVVDFNFDFTSNE